MKFFDVNLRPPFADPVLVIDLAQRVDVIKLNDDEVGKLASWLKTGETTLNTPRSPDALAEACAALAKATNTSRICAQGQPRARRCGRMAISCAPGLLKLPSKTQSARATHSWPGLMVGLTRGIDTQKVLENACRVDAFVASHNGATPSLPPEITQEFKRV
jgi:fructokinase